MSWDLDNWGSNNVTGADRVNAAYNFLETGVYTAPLWSGSGTNCTDSSQCASGFKCSGGQCVQVTTGGAAGGSGGQVGSGGGFGGSGGCDGGGDSAGGGAPGGGGGSSFPGSGPTGGGGSGCSGPTGSTPTFPGFDFGFGIGSGGGGGGNGGGGGCQTATCGDGGGAGGIDGNFGGGYGGGYAPEGACCGQRCCRFFATGISSDPVNVNCYCGDCPPIYGGEGAACGDGLPACGYGYACIDGYCREVKPCNKFCAEYYEANGEDAAGCNSDDRCDECTACNGDGNGFSYCKLRDSAPCWCPGAEGGRCDICSPSGTLIPGVCLECASIQNYECGCGFINIQVCQPEGTSGLSIVNKAQIAAARECIKLCEGDGGKVECNCNAECGPGGSCSAKTLTCSGGEA